MKVFFNLINKVMYIFVYQLIYKNKGFVYVYVKYGIYSWCGIVNFGGREI